MEKAYDVEVVWLPFDLHPEIPPEGRRPPDYVRETARNAVGERLREMARESGREIVLDRDWIPSTRRALEASEYAREEGRHEAFHRIVFRKFYGEGEDIGEWDVLRAAAVEAGLDPDEMQRETESGRYKAIVDEHTRQAHSVGVTGVPAYILGNKYLIMGAQPYELFQEVMAELKAETPA